MLNHPSSLMCCTSVVLSSPAVYGRFLVGFCQTLEVLSWFGATCSVWLAILANTAVITAPLVLAQNPVSTLQETASEAKDVRTGRGQLFLVLAVFFFAEGLGILAYPTLAQRVSHLCHPVSLPPGYPCLDSC